MKESFAPTKRVLSVRRIGACAGTIFQFIFQYFWACAGSPKLKNSPGYTPARESTLDIQTTADTETMTNENADDDTRVLVTVLTGFLGSDKTTLLNRILTATHRKKTAVIENEFGDVGIDALLQKNTKMQSEEEIIETMNGCICCTIRQDLVKVLEKLADRVKKGALKLDGIIIETTGAANPAPVAQTSSLAWTIP